MNNVCSNVKINISTFLKSNDLYNMILISKNNTFLQKYMIQKCKIEIIQEYFNPKIIELFGGIDTFKNFKILPWNKKYIGFTDYIDSIKLKDLNDNKIVIGIDDFSRPFIAMKNKNNNKVSILFQRYFLYQDIWACANFDNIYGHILVNNHFKCDVNLIKDIIK